MGKTRSVLLLLALVSTLAGTALSEEVEDDRARLLLEEGAAYRDLTLDEAVRMGVRSNLALLAGAYDPSMAMEQYRAESSIFDPLLSSTFEYGHQETPQISAFFGVPVTKDESLHFEAGVSKILKTGGSVGLLYQADRLDTNNAFITMNPSWTQSTVLQATQPLLRGAGDVVMADIRSSRNGVTIAQENQRGLVQTILFRIVSAYWHLVYTQEQVGARLKSEDVAAELLRDAEARLKAKVGTPLNVAEARAGLERRKGDRIGAVGQRGDAQDALRALILPFGTNTETGFVFRAVDKPTSDRAMAPDPTQLDRYVSYAISNRPELRASKANLANRSIDMYSAANALKPQLDLIGQIGTAGLDGAYGGSLGDMATGEAVSGTIGVQFSMFVGRRAAKASLRMTEWARRQAEVNMKGLQNEVELEVRNAIRNVLVTAAIETASSEQVEASKEDLRGEKHLLDNGKSTPFQVLLKEDTVTDALTRLFRSTSNRRIAEAEFWRSIGMLAETLGVQGNGTRFGLPADSSSEAAALQVPDKD